ncbi:unnamed protein product [Urochloa decumbens]|uniref:Cytochrome P450 n=1 Tax=Urochloa decumbens TaxID=240449 RepID=A0ABC9FJ81_9POAL
MAPGDLFLALRHVPFWSVLLIAPLILYLLAHGKRKTQEKTIFLPPSPLKLPFIGHLHLMVKEPQRTLQRLARRMGPVIHLQLGGVPAVVVSSPEAAKEVLKTVDVHCCNRPSSPGAKMLTYDYRDIAFSPYSERWRERRKLFISELVGSKRAQSFSHALEEQVDQLIQSLSNLPSMEPINLNDRIFALIDGFIGTVAFGRMNGTKLLKYKKFQQVFSDALLVLSAFSAQDFFPTSPISRWVDKLVGLERRYQTIFGELDAYFETVLSQHMDPGRVQSQKDNLVDVLISLWKGQGNKGLAVTKDDLKAIIMDAFIGGTSTSSVTLLWAMSELIKNPRVMKKVQSEIRSSVHGKPRVQVSDTPQLKYLRMVIKETLRLHPPAPFLVPRETMQHVNLLGYDVPPKTRIFVNVWAIGRDPTCWKNPEEFCPERFEDVDIDFKGLNFELLPFGAGRRICPAIPMGVMNVEFTLASLLHSFDWKLPEGMIREDVSMEGTGRQIVSRRTPLYLVPSPYYR